MNTETARTPEEEPTTSALSLSDRAAAALEHVDDSAIEDILALRDDFTRFIMPYKFGIDEVNTKIGILREEFNSLHDYNPIEHVSSRLKTLEHVVDKALRKGCEPTFDAIRHEITDIAGIRITCSFVSDVYRMFDMLVAQNDIRLVVVKDYIAHPKPNGYQSLHAIIEVPVFLSSGPVPVPVEVQIRTVAMDFWASLEHKIYYKYDQEVPQNLLDELAEAAHTASMLDLKMERIHSQIHGTSAALHPASEPDDGRPQHQQHQRSTRGPLQIAPRGGELTA